MHASSFASDAEKTNFGWRSTASTASQAFACDAFSLNASTVVMSAVASRKRAKFVATDALLARRASSLPAASQVFIAACKAVEASCKAWAIVGGACDDADQSERPQEFGLALLIAAIDHFSGKLLFVISDSKNRCHKQALCGFGFACLPTSLMLVCYLPLARPLAARVSS